MENVKIKLRDYYFDNLKFLLILLVVTGHLIENIADRFPELRSLYLLIYFFHMPLFVFTSGYFSKNFIKQPKLLLKSTFELVYIFVLFQILYYFFNNSQVLTFFTPFWILWFIMSLIFWRILLFIFAKYRYAFPCALIIALITGYIGFIGYDLSLSRTIVFFPFFLLGYYAQDSHMRHFKTGLYKKIYAGVLISAAFLLIYKFGQNISPGWLYGSYSYSRLGHAEWYAFIWRIGIYLVSFILSAAFLTLVSDKKRFFTKNGGNSITAYLIHGFVVLYLVKIGFFSNVLTWYEISEILIGGIVLAFILSLDVVRKSAGIIIEPHKVFKNIFLKGEIDRQKKKE